jgi:hypothetical protein
MADSIQDQLQAFLAIQEANKRTTDQIEEQRSLMSEMVNITKAMKIPYRGISRDIGQSVKDLTLFEGIERDLYRLVVDRSTLEKNLTDQIEQKVKRNSEIAELTKLSSDAVAKDAQKQIDLDFVHLKLTEDLLSLTGVAADNRRLEAAAEEAQIENKYNNLGLIIQQYKDQNKIIDLSIKKTRELLDQDQKKINKLQTQNKLVTHAKEILGQMGDLGKHISDWKFPDFTDVLKKGVTNFLDFDKVAFGLRKQFGLLRGDFSILETNVKSIGVEAMDIGVSFESAAAATAAIGNDFNGLVASNKQFVSDISIVAAQLGIAEADSAKFVKTMASISGTTSAAQKGMIGFTKQLSNAAGTPLPAIMKDIADASDDIRIFTGNALDNLIKGAVQARFMGTTLQNTANTAKRLLDFNTSIADEMEASVLLGRDLNLQRARTLAYNKDIVGATQEILRISKLVDFDALDPFQAEAFAKATGKSVHELQDMLQADKEINWIRNNGNAQQKAQLQKMEELKKARLSEAKDIGKTAELRLKQEANQERLITLQNQFNRLMSELAGPVMDLVEPILDLAVKGMPILISGFKGLVGIAKVLSGINIARGFFTFMSNIDVLLSTFTGAFRSGTTIISSFKLGIESVAIAGSKLFKTLSFLPSIGKFFAPLMKIAGPIGLAITVVQGLLSVFSSFYSSFKDFRDGNYIKGFIKGFTAIPKALIDITLGSVYDLFTIIFGWFNVDLPKGIWTGIAAVGDKITSGITGPFKTAWAWLKDTFMGNSPSQLGLKIVDGLLSVGSQIIDALMSPFRFAFNAISGLFNGPILPKMSDIAVSHLSDSNTKQTTSDVNSKLDISSIIVESNKKVVEKIDQLITMMATGGISVNIDGTKASHLLSKAQRERGAFGAT